MPNVRENFICELGILAVLSRDSGQHPRKFYLQISFLEPPAKILSHENFPLYGTSNVTEVPGITLVVQIPFEPIVPEELDASVFMSVKMVHTIYI